MLVKIWRFLTVILMALSLGPALAHVLELPARRTVAHSISDSLWSLRYVRRCIRGRCSHKIWRDLRFQIFWTDWN